MGVYLVRNLHSSIPPYFGLKKEKNRKKKESWQDKRQKETAPPPPFLNPRSGSTTAKRGINMLPIKPHNRTTTSAGRGMRLSVQAGKLK